MAMQSLNTQLSVQAQCQICQRIAKALHSDSGYRVPKFYNDHGFRYAELGSWNELKQNVNCPTCLCMAKLFDLEFQNHTCNSSSTEYQLSLTDLQNTDPLLLLRSESCSFVPMFSIQPLSREFSEEGAVLLDQDMFDFKRVLKWIRNCDTMHGVCHCPIFPSDKSFSSQDMYLVSTSRRCIVKAKAREKYVALSYVWGSGLPKFTTTKLTLELLQEDGSLSNARIQDRVPGTVRRAMHFTSMLGVEYLWTDILCIVQDDPVHVASQINGMAKIYSNSYITLCVADGEDGESGLRGIPECSLSRDVHQDVLTFMDGSVASQWIVVTHPKVDVWATRGWTFQENILSRRTLTFRDNGLVWRCHEAVAQEQFVKIKRVSNHYMSKQITLEDTLWPCLKKWDNLLSGYLRRTLTNDNDILHAFSGILEALGRSMHGGFHYGLPEQFFDISLLWVPRECLSRRKNTANTETESVFPSWSWAGWKGAISSQINNFGLEHERSNPLFDIKLPHGSIYFRIKWFKVTNDAFEKVEICNDYGKYREDGIKGTLRLPFGWTSYREPNDGPFYYKHDNAPPSYTFWYPIPVVQNPQPILARQWAPLLYCVTWRGYLELGSLFPKIKEDWEDDKGDGNDEDNWDHNWDLIYSLRKSDGKWAGVIYLHNPPEDTDEKEQCELILLSAGRCDEEGWIPEWHFPDRSRIRDYYQFYHVLWIEWRGGIAYRKGLGRVDQVIWEDLSKDKIEVRLG